MVLEVTFSPATMGTWDVPLEVSVEGSNIEPDTFFVDLTGMAHAAEVPTEPVDVGIHVVTPSGPLADVSGSASNPGCLPGSSDGTGACEVGNVAPDANLVVDGRFVGTGHGWLTLPPNAWIPPWTQGTLEISLPDDAIVEAAPVSTSVGTLTFEAPAGTILRFGELVPLVSADAWLAGLGIDPTRVVWSAHIDAGLLPRDVVVTSDTAFPAKGVMSLVRSQDGAVLPLAITGGTSFTVPEAGIVVLTD
ncbi:MAG: hypothetical protein R3F61_17185 [Myxococcota bacterium]